MAPHLHQIAFLSEGPSIGGFCLCGAEFDWSPFARTNSHWRRYPESDRGRMLRAAWEAQQ